MIIIRRLTPPCFMPIDLHGLKAVEIFFSLEIKPMILYIKKELDQLAKRHSDLKIHYIVPPNYLDEIAIGKFVADLAKPYFYISGPKPMVQAFEKLLPEMSIPIEHLKRDYFPGYDR